MSAMGGGTWLFQNKILPGAYINFVALNRANPNISDRGLATAPVILDWGVQGEVMEVTTRDFQRNSKALFGYDFTHPHLRPLREFFRHIRIGYIWRLGTGGTRAQNDYAIARYNGTRGNDITIQIGANVDDPALWDVYTFMDRALVDQQTTADMAGLTPNDYVTWNASATLQAEAGVPLEGGTSPVNTNFDYQVYLDNIEGYGFNSMCCPSDQPGVKLLFSAFNRRLRDEQGVKFQLVSYDNPADFEGIVDIKNPVTGLISPTDVEDNHFNEYDLVWWVTSLNAGARVNQSITNRVYDGEYQMECNYTHPQAERAIRSGKFMFYRSGASEMRILSDINSLRNVTLEKNEDFMYNQTIRVIDQIGNDIAILFNTRFLGIVPNDEDGRIALWSDIVRFHEQMQTVRAIQEFEPEHVTVEQGANRRAVRVDAKVMPVNAMAFLYMTVYVA